MLSPGFALGASCRCPIFHTAVLIQALILPDYRAQFFRRTVPFLHCAHLLGVYYQTQLFEDSTPDGIVSLLSTLLRPGACPPYGAQTPQPHIKPVSVRGRGVSETPAAHTRCADVLWEPLSGQVSSCHPFFCLPPFLELQKNHGRRVHFPTPRHSVVEPRSHPRPQEVSCLCGRSGGSRSTTHKKDFGDQASA